MWTSQHVSTADSLLDFALFMHTNYSKKLEENMFMIRLALFAMFEQGVDFVRNVEVKRIVRSVITRDLQRIHFAQIVANNTE